MVSCHHRIGPFVTTVAGTLYIPTLTATIINDGVLKGDLEMITNSSMNMLVVALLTVLSAILGVAMNAHISASVGKVLRDDLVKALQYFSLRDFTHFGTGTILMRTSRDVEKFNLFSGRFKYDPPYATHDLRRSRTYLL